MTFSNVNIFKSSLETLKTNDNGPADRIKKGGAFAPNTFEAVSLMRSDLDNQWESAFIVSYQALMQNRLNRLKQDLTNAYKALLEAASTQQIRDNGTNSTNTALTDVYGNMIKDSNSTDSINEAFRGLHYFEDSTDLSNYDGGGSTSTGPNKSAADGVPSYYIKDTLTQYDGNGNVANTSTGSYEMRKLYVNGPALSIVNTMKVAFRTEEVPPKRVDVPLVGSILGTRAYIGGEKVAEYSADVKSGGYWATLNYLYDFAPREMKYSYPTAYSTTTEEAGTRDLTAANDTQALLFEGNLTDARDAGKATENNGYAAITYDAGGNKPKGGERIKFVSSNANDGYLTEKSSSFNITSAEGPDVDTLDARLITRRAVDNDNQFQYLTTKYAQADNIVKSSFSLAPDGSDGKTKTEYGDEEFSGGSIQDKIKWTYQHDGTNAADIGNLPSGATSSGDTRDGNADNGDVHSVRANFVNHYIVQTQSVELNSSDQSYGIVKALGYNATTGATITDDFYNNGTNPANAIKGDYSLLRSTGIDGSADHVFNDENGDGIIQDNENEKLLLPGSGKISKNFDGNFVARQYQISSFNGQDIATDNANINISSANNGGNNVVIAEYEGFKRADTMTKGLAKDNYSDATVNPMTESNAIAFINKVQTEINATTMVDSDWHYAEYNKALNDPAAKDSIQFKQIKQVNYTSSDNTTGVADLKYNPNMIDNAGNFNNVTVAYRKTFTLTAGDFQDAVYSTPTNSGVYINTPTYQPKDVLVQIDTTGRDPGTPADLIVNGKVVPPTTPGGNIYNLKGFLQEGDNVIATQVKYTHADTATSVENTFKLSAYTGTVGTATNQTKVNKWINSDISTDRTQNGDTMLTAVSQTSITGKPLSAWQSKVMVNKITPDYFNSIYQPPLYSAPDPSGSTPATYTDPTTGANITYTDTTVTPNVTRAWASDTAYQEYIKALNGLGSVQTATKVKSTNTFAQMLTDILNKKEYQDIFNLGLLNTNLGKTMMIKAQVSAPTGGSITATMDIQYDPINNKFVLVQNKFDAFSGL